jgi:CRISPR-associated protein Cas1
MQAMRWFPGEDVDGLTMQQTPRPGRRTRPPPLPSPRPQHEWEHRNHDPDNFDDGTPVNQALSAANTSLFGVVHAVIVALGCAPGLRFVHTGHIRSFVYDIADLYKAGITLPIAFDIAARGCRHQF